MRAHLFGCSSVVLGLMAIGCGSGHEAGAVHLDFTGVFAQALTSTLEPVDRIRVRELAKFEVIREVVITPEAPRAELTVAPGLRSFEAIAEAVDGGDARATYYGDLRVPIAPFEEREVHLPMFPAGTLQVDVEVRADVTLPDEEIIVTFVPQDPRPDQSLQFAAPFSDSSLTRVLPAGIYNVTGAVTFNGDTYEAFGDRITTTIEHGVVHRELLSF